MYSNHQNETGRPEGRPADAQPGSQSVEDVKHGTHTDVCMLGTTDHWIAAREVSHTVQHLMTNERKKQVINLLLNYLKAALAGSQRAAWSTSRVVY